MKAKTMKAKTDCWRYNAVGARLFKEGEEIPAGYVDSPAKVTVEPETDTDSAADDLSDAELRDVIKTVTGNAPGPRTKRETLIAQYDRLQAEAV